MKQNIYKNKKTGKKVITSEKLDSEHWEKVSMIKGAKMEGNEVSKK